MIIRLVDLINKKFANRILSKVDHLNKNNFKFECTYIWASLVANLFWIATFLLIISGIYLIGMMIVVGNINYFNPELASEIYKSNFLFGTTYIDSAFIASCSMMAFMFDFLVSVGAIIFLIVSFAPRVLKFGDRVFDAFLAKFCKKIVKTKKDETT